MSSTKEHIPFPPELRQILAAQPYSIAPGLHHLAVPMLDLEPDPENPKRHPERNLAELISSLVRYGQTGPIRVWRPPGAPPSSKPRILAGNGLWAAALALGGTYIAAIDLSHLSEADALKYTIADNRLGELSEWEQVALRHRLQEIERLTDGDLAGMGYDEMELEPLLLEEHTPPGDGDGESASEPSDSLDEKQGLLPEDDASRARPLVVTPAQREVFEQASQRMAELWPDLVETDTKEGRLLELLCADWMSGAGFPEGGLH